MHSSVLLNGTSYLRSVVVAASVYSTGFVHPHPFTAVKHVAAASMSSTIDQSDVVEIGGFQHGHAPASSSMSKVARYSAKIGSSVSTLSPY
jgi:hypothetical protein